MPLTVVDTVNDGKSILTLVAHIGIIGYDRVLISLVLVAYHFINELIKKIVTF